MERSRRIGKAERVRIAGGVEVRHDSSAWLAPPDPSEEEQGSKARNDKKTNGRAKLGLTETQTERTRLGMTDLFP